jgi:hypothetical protein
MTKTRTYVIALSLCATFGCSEHGLMPASPAGPSALGATNAKPGAGDVPVTSAVQSGFDIAGDGIGGYTNSSTLKSVIASNNGVWYLDLRNSKNTTRTVSLNFGPGHPLTGGHKVFMYTACNFDNYNNVNLLNLAVGATVPCPMAIQFDHGGKQYLLRMNSNQDTGTHDVDITRLSTTTWQIRPSVTGGNNARLSLQGKGNAGLVPQGDFQMSFAIDLTNP